MSSSCAAGFEHVPEQRTPVDLQIHGVIPPWLSGVLYRTGPGTTRIPTTADPSKVVEIQHWFDGLALHHRFEIFPGGERVSYRSHNGSDDLERQIAEAGRYPTLSFGQRKDPCQAIFRNFSAAFQAMRAMGVGSPSPSGVNVSVTLTPDMPGLGAEISGLSTPSGARYIVAKSDANALQIIDPETLEPLLATTYEQLDPRLDGPLSAAHSCRDQETGDFYNYSCKFGARFPTYKIFRIGGKDGKVDVLAEIKDAPPSYIHSFAMTKRFVVLCVWQAHMKYFGLSLLYYKNIAESIEQRWDPKLYTLFYVVDRKDGGLVAKYKTPPFFCFHIINAFDDPATDDIIIDMSVYKDNSVINLLYLDKLRNLTAENYMPMGSARRFRLPSPSSLTTLTAAGDAIVEFTLPQFPGIELPVVAPSVYNKPYRYAYGIAMLHPEVQRTITDGIIKLDMSSPSSSSTTKFWSKPNHTPSEPVFVPHPNGKDEDDGVLLSIVLDEQAKRSSMVVIDAKEMKEVASAEMGTVFPIGFHGVWSEGKV